MAGYEIAVWLQGIGTVLVFAIALFHDFVYERITRPVFQLSVDSNQPDCMMLLWGREEKVNGGVCYPTWPVFYLRLRVKNSGKRRAENVQVRLMEVRERQLDGNYAVRTRFPPMNLAWSRGGTSVLPAVQPGTFEHCNLAHILGPDDRKHFPFEQKTWSGVDPMKTILSVDTFDRLYALPHLLPAGSYRLTLDVTSDNAKPVRAVVQICLHGQWYDNEDMMRQQGVAVQLLGKRDWEQ